MQKYIRPIARTLPQKSDILQVWEGRNNTGERSLKIWFRSQKAAEVWSATNNWRPAFSITGRVNCTDGPWRSETHHGYDPEITHQNFY